MDISFAVKLLDVLIENSSRVLAAGFGVNCAESSFFDVVTLLKQEDALKEPFLERARITLGRRAPEQLSPGAVPVELIELVAHEMRWRELLDLAEDRILKFFNGDPTLAIGDIACRLPEAYDDNWKDREFYKKYRTN